MPNSTGPKPTLEEELETTKALLKEYQQRYDKVCDDCDAKNTYVKTLEHIVHGKGVFVDIQHCFIKSRPEDNLGKLQLMDFPLRIHGYAIVPIEEWEALGGEK